MDAITWIILGIVAGAVAKLLMPARDGKGWASALILGFAGSVVGGFIGRSVWPSPGVNGVNFPGILMAVLGAVVVLGIYATASRAKPFQFEEKRGEEKKEEKGGRAA